jgi:hypothetical protein
MILKLATPTILSPSLYASILPVFGLPGPGITSLTLITMTTKPEYKTMVNPFGYLPGKIYYNHPF